MNAKPRAAKDQACASGVRKHHTNKAAKLNTKAVINAARADRRPLAKGRSRVRMTSRSMWRSK